MNMKLLELKNFGVFDIILLALFVVYIVFPVPTPQWLVPAIDSPIGMLIIFAAAVSLFVYRSPILGVLFILVAYELLRRNHHVPTSSPIVVDTQYLANRVPQRLPSSQQDKNSELQALNPPRPNTLEEEIVEKQSPIGVSQLPVMTNTSFHPVNDRTELGMASV
jgi:hypothetical protein